MHPAPELPRFLALPGYCAVPPSTPVVAHGIDAAIPSAGPYYLAAHTDSVAVLKRNPNYRGPRPQHLDAIVYELGVAPAAAASRIEKGKLDTRHGGRRLVRRPGAVPVSVSTWADREPRSTLARLVPPAEPALGGYQRTRLQRLLLSQARGWQMPRTGRPARSASNSGDARA